MGCQARAGVARRVLRSAEGPATGAFDDTVAGAGQTLVSDQVTPGSRDEQAEPGATYYYTVFAEDERGRWLLLASPRVSAPKRPPRCAEGDFVSGAPASGRFDAAWAGRAGSGDHPRR